MIADLPDPIPPNAWVQLEVSLIHDWREKIDDAIMTDDKAKAMAILHELLEWLNQWP